MAYFEQPDPSIFLTTIDHLQRVTDRRMALLREMQRIINPFDPACYDKISQALNEQHLQNSVQAVTDSAQNALSYWICRFAMTSEDDSNWLAHGELCLYLYLSANTVSRKLPMEFEKLTAQNRQLLFPPHMQHLVPEDLPNPYVLRDFAMARPLLKLQQYTVLNRCLIASRDEALEWRAHAAKFLKVFEVGAKPCEGLVEDPEVDGDLAGLLLNVQRLRLGAVQLQTVQQAARRGFGGGSVEALIRRGAVPLCAVRLVRHMQKQNKLKHQERLQLYTYLKDAGMGFDDAKQLVKKHFTEGGRMTEDTFRKEYEYNIAHVFGLVGQKKGAHCASCAAIVGDVPPTGFAFGCPFRSMNQQDIEELIVKNIQPPKIDAQQLVGAIRRPLEAKAYESACQHFFAEIFGAGTGGSTPWKYTQAALSVIGEE